MGHVNGSFDGKFRHDFYWQKLDAAQNNRGRHFDLFSMSPDNIIDKIRDRSEDPANLTFGQMGLSPILLAAVEKQGWTEPTPIQRIAIPAFIQLGSNRLAYKSLWAESGTGTGKTAAYTIPLLQLILESNKEQRRINSKMPLQPRQAVAPERSHSITKEKMGAAVTALILSPTRELAMQIGSVILSFINSSKDLSHLTVSILTGGVPIEPQIEMLAERNSRGQSLDILIATPGRLIDLFSHESSGEMGSDTVQDKALEKQLIAALDLKIQSADSNKIGHKRRRKNTSDMSLSFNDIEKLKINDMISSAGRDGGRRSSIQNILSNVQYLVLDEADRLLSSGFKNEMDQILTLLPPAPSTSPDLERKQTYHQLKTLLFSATFPKQIEPRVYHLLERLYGKQDESSLPLRLLVDVKTAVADQRGNNSGTTSLSSPLLDLNVEDLTQSDEALTDRQQRRLEKKASIVSPQISIQGSESTIDLRIIRMEEKDRTQVLRRLLDEYGSEQWDRVLVFVSTRYASEHVASKLTRANIRAAELHGKLDQNDRTRRLDDFRHGKIQVLVATDLASRGLDVVGLPAVVNYDLPRSSADFQHRIGRCGRAQNRGVAVSFVTAANESHMDLIEKRHLKQTRNTIPREVLKGFEPDEEKWSMTTAATKVNIDGIQHSFGGFAYDRMHGGIKGRRKSKKDKIREKAVLEQKSMENPNE